MTITEPTDLMPSFFVAQSSQSTISSETEAGRIATFLQSAFADSRVTIVAIRSLSSRGYLYGCVSRGLGMAAVLAVLRGDPRLAGFTFREWEE